MRQALAVALQDYEGAVVLVSHDRHLLRAVADELILVDEGRASPFDGDLDDYARWFIDVGCSDARSGDRGEVGPEQTMSRRSSASAKKRSAAIA